MVNFLQVRILGSLICRSIWGKAYAVSLAHRVDEIASFALDLLTTAGIDFGKLKKEGIHPNTFAEHLFSSGICITLVSLGLVLNEDLTWVTYRGTYDLFYLLKLATSQPLPESFPAGMDCLNKYFPHFFDIKCMLQDLPIPEGSLSSIANYLKVSILSNQNRSQE